jgi:hypothetical protein
MIIRLEAVKTSENTYPTFINVLRNLNKHPKIVFCYLFVYFMVFLASWNLGAGIFPDTLIAFIGFGLFPLIPHITLAWSLRNNRVWLITDHYIKVGVNKIRWSNIATWHITPIDNQSGLINLVIKTKSDDQVYQITLNPETNLEPVKLVLYSNSLGA